MRLFRLLAGLTAGVGAAPYLPSSPSLFISPIATAILSLLLYKRKISTLLFVSFFFLAGASLYHLHRHPPFDSDHIRTFAGPAEVSITGTLLNISKRPSGKSVIDIDAHRIISQKIAAKTHGRLRLYVDRGEVSLIPGERVRFLSKIKIPRKFGTPGEFDMPRHLASRGIYATAFVKDASALVPIGRAVRSWDLIERWRFRVESIIEETLSPSAAPLVEALTIGIQSEIPPDKRETMAEAGVSHLFAISGLHLGMVALVLYMLGATLYRRSTFLLTRAPPRRYLPLFILPFLWNYLLLTGGSVATQRAFMMASGGALILLSARRSPPLHLLASAAFLLLLANPLLLFEPAFQLSVSAVAGLIILLPRWRPSLSGRHPLIQKAGTLLLATSAATLSTAPVVIFHFHQFPTATLLCNLLAVPLIGFVALPLGLAGVLATPLSPPLASLLFQGCGYILTITLSITKSILELPGFSGVTLYPSPKESIALCLLAASILMAPRIRHYRKTCLLCLTIAIFLFIPPQGNVSELRATILSVGQGDSMLISLDGKEHFLIDGGGLFSDSFDTGERLVAPALGQLGIDTLKGVILTHEHPDHWKGLPYILEHFAVETFWSNLKDEQIPPPVRKALVEQGIPTTHVTRGWNIVDTSSTSSMSIYMPKGRAESANDKSLSLYVGIEQEGLLLTGDIETSGVEELIESPPPGAVTLLKIPHHGSRKSSPDKLLDHFSPEILFVSLGLNNSYNFPHEEVTRPIRQRGIPLYRTDTLGTLTFSTTGEGWKVDSCAKGVFH